MFTRNVCILMVAAAFSNASLAAEESPDWNATTLTGDWGGARSSLYNKGISMEFSHKSDVLANTSGGLQRGSAWVGHTEARIKFDLEKLLDWDATAGYIHYHSQLGSKFNTYYVGSFVGVDNIEAYANTAQFAQAWLQKNFADDRFSVLAGLYQIDSEFYVTDTSGVFMQPPYGMSNDVAQPIVGASNAPPIFPIGALAMRAKYTSPSKNYYAQYALTDGVPGDPNNPRGTHIQLNKGDGSLSIAEFGYTPQEEQESFNKTAIGFWHYSARFRSIDQADPQLYASQGIYLLAERSLMAKHDHPEQGLAGFVRFGTASKDVHQADWTGSLGLRYRGLFSGYDEDIAGVAVTFNHTSSKYRQNNVGADSNQTQVEATYRAQLQPWLALQPTVQYIGNPNMDPALKDAWVVGARAEINF